jgi:hypothetical protein
LNAIPSLWPLRQLLDKPLRLFYTCMVFTVFLHICKSRCSEAELPHHFPAIVVPQHFFKHLVSAIVSASIILFIGSWGSRSPKKNAFWP